MPISSNPVLRLFQIFSAKLVLEVFGGAGAIWGFSEAIGFRTPATVWFWRPCALTFGAIFFVRWIMQIDDFMVESGMKESPVSTTETVELMNGEGAEKADYGMSRSNSSTDNSSTHLQV